MKKKRDDTWDYIWISAVLFGIPLTISWIKKSINPISPIVAMIGIVGVVSCGYLLSKFIKGQISGEQRNKSKIKYTSITCYSAYHRRLLRPHRLTPHKYQTVIRPGYSPLLFPKTKLKRLCMPH